MNIARQYGAHLAKLAYDYSEVDKEHPIWNRVKQDTGIGLRSGALIGGLGGLSAGAVTGALSGQGIIPSALGGAVVGGAIGGGVGGGIGLGVGGMHGGYDAGLVHALRRRVDPGFDDHPSLRAALVNSLTGLGAASVPNAVIGAGLSELGKVHGRAAADPEAALAAMR